MNNQFNKQNLIQFNNQQTNTPDFEQYLNDADQYTDNSISHSSKHTYDSNLHVYDTTMNLFGKTPYPITIQKMKVFLTYQAKERYMTINILLSYITALSYYFKSNDLPNLTLSNEFKMYKSGLQRSFKSVSSPYAKLPFKTEFFLCYLQQFDMSDIENVKMMFYMTLPFYAFLRISELLNLKKKDIVYDVELNKLIITIRFSKTDQTGKGFTTYLYNNNHKIYHPLNYIGVISNLNNEDSIVDITEDHLRKNLNNVLVQLGFDKTKYSWHSFRRGGATLASQNHIDPAINKTHGRWQSEAYLLYVDRDQDNAGLQISEIRINFYLNFISFNSIFHFFGYPTEINFWRFLSGKSSKSGPFERFFYFLNLSCYPFFCFSLLYIY